MRASLIGKPLFTFMHITEIKFDSFDHYDFIFIDGNPNVLPWTKKGESLTKLFKKCKQTNKACFAAGIGMMQLTYYCATNSGHFEAINGDLGSSLSELGKISKV